MSERGVSRPDGSGARRNVRTFFELATGDGIYSWPLALCVSVLVTTTAITTQVQSRHLGWLQLVLITAASAVLMFGFVFVAWFLALRHLKGSVRILATFVTYGAGGLIQALAVFWLVPRAGGIHSSLFDVTYRSISYLLLMVILLSLGTFVVTTSRLHKERMEQLLSRRAAVDLLLTDIERKIRKDQQVALESIEVKLTAELDEIAHESPANAIVSTEYLVGGVVRPLSHQIARKVPQVSVPEIDPDNFEISWRALWRGLSAERFVHPIVTSLVTVVYILLLQVTLFSSEELDLYLWVFPVLAVGLWLARLIMRRLSVIRSRTLRYLLSTGLIAVLVTPAASVLTQAAGYSPRNLGLTVTFVIEAVVITWLITLAFGLAATIKARESELNKLDYTLNWVQARGNGALWQSNGQLARALHGPVQSELHAALFAIRAAITDDSKHGGDTSQQVTTDVIAELSDTLPGLLVGGHSRHSVLQEVADTAVLWQGICEITFTAEPEIVDQLTTDPVANDLVISIVQDSISNAIRHGGTTVVTVALEQPATDLVTLTVVDNGTKGLGDGSAGMGTHILQDCTINWSLTVSPDGSIAPGSGAKGASGSGPSEISGSAQSEASGSGTSEVGGSGAARSSGGCILEATLPTQVESASLPIHGLISHLPTQPGSS